MCESSDGRMLGRHMKHVDFVLSMWRLGFGIKVPRSEKKIEVKKDPKRLEMHCFVVE